MGCIFVRARKAGAGPLSAMGPVEGAIFRFARLRAMYTVFFTWNDEISALKLVNEDEIKFLPVHGSGPSWPGGGRGSAGPAAHSCCTIFFLLLLGLAALIRYRPTQAPPCHCFGVSSRCYGMLKGSQEHIGILIILP